MILSVSLRSAHHFIVSAQRCFMWIACSALVASVAATSAHAAFVTLNIDGLDKIYSQSPVLDQTPIVMRYNPTVLLDAPGLLTINTEPELKQLFGLGDQVQKNDKIVDLFFVNEINECGSVESPPAVGCGQVGGNHIVVESTFAAQQGSGGNPGIGAILIGHEVGHNLGLEHVADDINLMNLTLNGGFQLTLSQANTILQSDLVQTDTSGARFISITPFEVVPEPATMLFASVGALWMLQMVWRRAIT